MSGSRNGKRAMASENRERLDAFIGNVARETGDDRQAFFDQIYTGSGGDPDLVPWADLQPKEKFTKWLEGRDGTGLRALDIACGLGDHAEALSAAGYGVSAFDLSSEAISWAKQRFPDTRVDYRVADLFDLPGEWLGGFDLVYECYTLQALPPETISQTAKAIASTVAPGGTLLVYARWREDDQAANGPPWPLRERDCMIFADLGFELLLRDDFVMERPDKKIPHVFAQWRRT